MRIEITYDISVHGFSRISTFSCIRGSMEIKTERFAKVSIKYVLLVGDQVQKE